MLTKYVLPISQIYEYQLGSPITFMLNYKQNLTKSIELNTSI